MPHTQHYNNLNKGTNDFREGKIDLGNTSSNHKSLKNFFFVLIGMQQYIMKRIMPLLFKYLNSNFSNMAFTKHPTRKFQRS